MNLELCREQLLRDEGVSLKPYKCTEGYWTIGVGRNLDTKGLSQDEQFEIFGTGRLDERQQMNHLNEVGITEGQAEYLLENDIYDVLSKVDSSFGDIVLDDARKGALVNMCFQMGVAGVSKFKNTLEALREGDWERASIEVLDSRYARQTPHRARRISKQILTGEWV